jgi:hypothetical protein
LSKFILVIIPVCPDNTVYAKLLLRIPSLQEWHLFVFDEFLGGLDNIYAHKNFQTQKDFLSDNKGEFLGALSKGLEAQNTS